MFPKVALSASGNSLSPSPKNSTNLPTTPCLRNISVTVKTRSVAVVPSFNFPVNFKPTTCGISMVIACPNIAASASIPPTPHPKIPNPLIIVVCESVPITVSGYNLEIESFPFFLLKIILLRYSKLT